MSDYNNLDNHDEFGSNPNEEKEDLIPKILEKELPKNPKNQSVSLAVWFGIVFGVAASVFVAWNIIAPKLNKSEKTEIPLIKSSTAPIKVRPSEPGGMEIQNVDRQIYGRIEAGEDEPVVENILPPPEEPMNPEINVVNNDEKEYIFDDKETSFETEKIEDDAVGKLIEEVKTDSEEAKSESSAIAETMPTTEIKPIEVPEGVKTVTENIKNPALPPEKELAAVKTTETIVANVTQPAEVTAVTPKTENVAAKTETVKNVASLETGAWKVQLLSVKDKNAALKEWENISKKYPEILSGIAFNVEEADLGAKGIFYRLKIGGYKDRTAAENLCSQLKEKKQGCFVVK
ncbi:MAG: SPOR domain-containing protein [Alphaproteobacteria bacterium]